MNENNLFVDCKTAVHELDPNSKEDIHIMDRLSKFWGGYGSCAQHIDYNFTACRQYSFLKDLDRFYVITANDDKNSLIEFEDILWVVQTRFQKDNNINVVFMQVNPKYEYGSVSNIKNIGTGMLTALKEMYAGKELSVYSIRKAIPFYMKNGFKKFAEMREGSQLMKYKPVLNKLI